MVAYGTTLLRARRPGWEHAYLDYDGLRSLLEEIESLCNAELGTEGVTIDSLEEAFLLRLRKEIEKVSLFTLTRQGEIAETVGSLRFKEEADRLKIFHPSASNLPGPSYNKDNDDDSDSEERIPVAGHSYDSEEAALLPRGSIVSGPLTTPKPSSKKSAEEARPMFRGDALVTPATTHYPAAIADEYTALGVELLHLLKFICINAMGIRKILKKYDKIILRAQQSISTNQSMDDDNMSQQDRLVGGPEDHLQQLANSASIAAIYSSLLAELTDLESNVMLANGTTTNGCVSAYQAIEEGRDNASAASLLRFKCTVSTIHTLREYAQRVNQPFQAFLSSKAMILTGHDPDGLERETQKALSLIWRFQPDSLLLMDKAALDDWERRSMPESSDASIGDFDVDLESWGGVNSTSMIISLMSTLFYTVNYYIVAPTANHYAIILGTDGAFGATLVGASSFSAIFAAFIFSVWYTKSSFRSALLFSALCPCVGNLLYALAISYRSMQVAILGRILVGFGSAEVVNRQLISACVSFRNMTQASALFVAAGAIGMSVGPLLAAILDIVSGRDIDVDLELPFLPAGGIIYNHVSSPGFVMACLWLLEILALLLLFREPERINSGDPASDGGGSMVSFESELELSTYGTSTAKALNGGSLSSRTWWEKTWSELVSVKNLVFTNMALPVTFLLFGFIELADEVLISSCSMVCRRYFGWHGSRAGFLIACLGSLVLPAHYVVERASRYYTERKIMKLSVLFICASSIAILNYEGLLFDSLGLAAETVSASTDQIRAVNGTDTVDISIGGTSVDKVLNKEGEVPYDWGLGKLVYIAFLSAVFMGTIILEGVDTSIMAKATPVKLNNAFINSGLLATLVGTVGRVIGDSMITISAVIDKDIFTDFVNATFLPIIPLALVGYFLIIRFYSSLR
eukprot:CAMPEP_0178542176 /NCGR_PEP_ID=MMETSP0697-20121206/1923_1 /TAXON_ID=265572 /ORGANISM="Extubocellulus spinifer, Strain CCMP396" /LENGTH=918 /DNA_ID=CAMNT_0020174567 /DNA_START=66 /DNA_END=2822 /DNA_ORIENTATION=-